MGRLAEEPVANYAFAGHNLNLLGVRRRHICRAVTRPAKVGVLGRDEQVQNLNVVPVDRHVPKLAVPVREAPPGRNLQRLRGGYAEHRDLARRAGHDGAMSAEASGQKQTEIRYGTADFALRRRSVELVRSAQGPDIHWYLRLRLDGNFHESTFAGQKSRHSEVPAALKHHLAGISGGGVLEPEQENRAQTTDDDGGRLASAADAPAILASMLQGLSDQLLVCDLAARLDLPDAIHQLRLTCRYLRALLKAAAPFLESSTTEDLDTRLRDLGRRCAPARDAEVIAESVSAGIDLVGDAVKPGVFDGLQKHALEQSALASGGRAGIC